MVVAWGKFQMTRLRQVLLVNSPTMLPLPLQSMVVPVTLITMALALPGLNSICCTRPLLKSSAPLTWKTATASAGVVVTWKRAGPG